MNKEPKIHFSKDGKCLCNRNIGGPSSTEIKHVTCKTCINKYHRRGPWQ